jgi:segregation and condensation protein A
MQQVNIKVESFEGPMDLLYSLIIKNKIDIYDIPIAELTDQYLEYVDAMKRENMESISEFLVMAATLIEIKSKLLLPKEVDENNEEIDPREELVKRLVEYKKFKLIANDLGRKQINSGFSFFKTQDKAMVARIRRDVPRDINYILNGADIDMLYNAFEEILRRRETKTDKIRSQFKAVTREEFTIEGRIEYILNLLELNESVSFFSMFRANSPKGEIIATFLAMLELIRKRHIVISQAEEFGDIKIEAYKEAV